MPNLAEILMALTPVPGVKPQAPSGPPNAPMPQGGPPPQAPPPAPTPPPPQQGGVQVPLSANLQQAAQVQVPQQQAQKKPLTPQQFQQSTTKWTGILQGMKNNPDAMAALLVLGNRLGKQRLPHETGLSRASDAVMQAQGQLGRSNAIRQALLSRKKMMMMEILKQQNEQTKAGSGRISANANMMNAETNRMEAQGGTGEQRLKEEKLRWEINRIKAQTKKDGGNKSIEEQWIELTTKLQEDDMGMGIAKWDKVESIFRWAHGLPDDYVLGRAGGVQPKGVAPGDPTPTPTTETETETETTQEHSRRGARGSKYRQVAGVNNVDPNSLNYAEVINGYMWLPRERKPTGQYTRADAMNSANWKKVK